MAKRLAKASKSTASLPADCAPFLADIKTRAQADIKTRAQADAKQTAGRDLRQTKLAKGKPAVCRHMDVAANEPKVNPPTGDVGRFYQHHLSPSLSPTKAWRRGCQGQS